MSLISASTDVYWNPSIGFVYAGDGKWGGASAEGTLVETWNSPFAGDPYTYEPGATFYGIRLDYQYLSESFSTNLHFITNFGRVSPNFPITNNTLETIEWQYSPEIGEHVTSIITGYEFGFFYSSSSWLGNIQMLQAEEELSFKWTVFRDTVETVTIL